MKLEAWTYPIMPKTREIIQIQRQIMIIGRICIKIKSNDTIRFLISQFDLIIGKLKV